MSPHNHAQTWKEVSILLLSLKSDHIPGSAPENHRKVQGHRKKTPPPSIPVSYWVFLSDLSHRDTYNSPTGYNRFQVCILTSLRYLLLPPVVCDDVSPAHRHQVLRSDTDTHLYQMTIPCPAHNHCQYFHHFAPLKTDNSCLAEAVLKKHPMGHHNNRP